MILKKFRDLLLSRGLTVYVLPRTDEHQSEYLAEEDERLAHISGFTGSSGLALISQDEALVWTDSRYFLQATKELTEGWKMMKMGKGQPTWFEHIAKKYKPEDTTIGIDARLLTAQVGIDRKTFLESKGFKTNFMESNLVDEIWERPKKHAQIFVHEQWAAKPANEKIKWVQNKIKELNGEGCLFSDLSQVGWVLNVRSAEIPYNPFMKSVLIVRPEGQTHTLYLPATHPNLKTMSQELANHLKSINVELKPYPFLPLPQRLLCQKKSLNYYIYSSMKDPIEWSGIGLFRAVREEKEREGFRQSHIRDGVAMAKFWGWRAGKESVGEYEAAEYINNLRIQQKHNMGLSFQTISAGGPNAAVVHYHPKKEPDFVITKNMIHLLDSGGQYLDGTTDVTRTFHFGEPSAKEKDAYTRVLLGNLDIERLKWPKGSGVTGSEIDVLARRHLWAKNLDYGHGTGHGVGYFQGVHEGPVGISRLNQCAFQPGMIVSNEPGYYEEGSFGIRIQNLILCVEDGDWNKFECLTLCPYDRNLIDLSLLTPKDIDHVNKYHERCWNTLDPLLGDDKVARDWLRAATQPL